MKPSAWNRAIDYESWYREKYPRSYDRMFVTRVKNWNNKFAKYTKDFTERTKHDVLFDNFSDGKIERLVKLHYNEIWIRYTCKEPYNPDCNMVIP